MNWPVELHPFFASALTCEFATLTRQQIPITHPLIPYMGENAQTLDVSTALTSPAKAERARQNPRVALLFSDPCGRPLPDAPVVLVSGLATVRDADLQRNTDRYVQLSLAKNPAVFQGVPAWFLRRLDWYFARIWIEVTPLRILWWPGGDTQKEPRVWQAPAEIQPPASDPPPARKSVVATSSGSVTWRKTAVYALRKLGKPVLTTVDAAGFPLPLRTLEIFPSEDGFRLRMPAGTPPALSGPACLTFHTHPKVLLGQENKSFLGHATIRQEREVHFVVERLLPDWSYPGWRVPAALAFLRSGRHLAPKLKAEAVRRGQAVPIVRLARRPGIF